MGIGFCYLVMVYKDRNLILKDSELRFVGYLHGLFARVSRSHRLRVRNVQVLGLVWLVLSEYLAGVQFCVQLLLNGLLVRWQNG